jgi:predicted RNA-binding Zn-ribbon protein involved in translation (DUF1610 family)
MAGMSTYPFKCDLCGGVTELAPTYGDFRCQHCGQAYVYDECHRIELSEPQLKTLRDSRWIPVSERLPPERELVLVNHDGTGIELASLQPGGGWVICWTGFITNGVAYTHWMPLPEPPEVK